MFLARKITRAKWVVKQDLSAGEISADAVTGDLRTQENSLSFWQCRMGAKADVEEAALAIAAAGNRVDKLDLVWISDDEFRADNQQWKDTEGRTPVARLARRHVDVYRLDYVRLGKVARRIAAAIEENRYDRLTKSRVMNLLIAAVRQGLVELDDLQEGVQAEVGKALEPGR